MKSPLQTWAWERFKLKGFLRNGQSLINHLIRGKYVSEKEHFLLRRIEREIDHILYGWDEGQRETRRAHGGKED